VGVSVNLSRTLDRVIPAWSAGIQADMDVSERILRTWIPAIHAGMTKSSFSFSVGDRKIMNHFVVVCFHFSLVAVSPLCAWLFSLIDKQPVIPCTL
jgi:hypothetical protein